MGRRHRSSSTPSTTPTTPPPAPVKTPTHVAGPGGRLTGVVAAGTLLVLLAVGYWIIYPMWRTDHELDQAKAAIADVDFPLAETHLKKVLEATPDNPEATFLLAQVYRRTNRNAAAWKQLDLAKKRDWIPEYIDLEKLLLTLSETGPTGSALNNVKLFIDASHPEDQLLFEGLAQAYLDAHMLNEAASVLDRWVQRYPDNWLPRSKRAVVREAMMNTDDAVADYRFVIEHRPQHPTARRRLAEIHLSARTELEAGAKLFEEQIRLFPDDLEAQVGLADLKNTMGRPDEAMQLVDAVLAKQPDTPRALALKAYLIRAKNPQQAYEILERVHALQPDQPPVLLALGQIAGELGRTTDSTKYMALHKLIDTEKKKQADLAIEVRRRPQDPEIRRQIGASMLLTGRDQEAMPWLLSALQIDPNHIPTYETLAAFYEGKGANPAEAARLRQQITLIKAQKNNAPKPTS